MQWGCLGPSEVFLFPSFRLSCCGPFDLKCRTQLLPPCLVNGVQLGLFLKPSTLVSALWLGCSVSGFRAISSLSPVPSFVSALCSAAALSCLLWGYLSFCRCVCFSGWLVCPLGGRGVAGGSRVSGGSVLPTQQGKPLCLPLGHPTVWLLSCLFILSVL